jgi:6-pyruvoyltetrahydropterin/6-carboxytetrahydropterin synthase
VHEHESKCAYLHGHNGRVHFTVRPLLNRWEEPAGGLDLVGRVLDFSVINTKLCQWLEENWDHKFLVSDLDPMRYALRAADKTVVWVPFNPTAERMAEYLLYKIGPVQLAGTGCELMEVTLEETRKCKATVSLKL